MVEILPMVILALWVVWRIIRGADKLIQTTWWEFTIAVVLLDIIGFIANHFISITLKVLHNSIINTEHTLALTLLTTVLISIPLAHILKKRALRRVDSTTTYLS
jgi:hypothetical protein